MPHRNLPEPPYRAELSRIAADTRVIHHDVAQLVLHDGQGKDYTVPMAPQWQPLPGRPGVRIFHVPAPGGEEGLFLTVFAVEAGSEYRGAYLDQSRLIALLQGVLDCNGRAYTAGNCFWLAPGEPSSWHAPSTAIGVSLYDSPPPDLDLSDFITPVKP